MPKVTFVKLARKPNNVVTQEDIDRAKSGEDPEAAAYYWWKFRYGGRRVSKTRPRPSQLTQSGYLSTVYSVQERAEDERPEYEDCESWLEELKDEIQCVGEEQRDNRDNMPESLQDSDTGCLLEERADCCESVVSELECIDIPDGDYADEQSDPEPDEEAEEDHEAWLERKEEWEAEQVDEFVGAVQDALGGLE